jgi:hypothetical protein
MTDRISSGFSFLSPSKGVDTDTDNIKIEQTDFNVDKSRKLEGSSELSADNYESSMLGLPISMPQDIKIFKSSAAKFVSISSTLSVHCFYILLCFNSIHECRGVTTFILSLKTVTMIIHE